MKENEFYKYVLEFRSGRLLFVKKMSKSLYPIIYVPQYTSDVMKADQSG
jgi:hypothetical protein